MPRHTILLVALALCAQAAAARAAPVEPRTEAAVLAADDDWLAAERRGDVAALDARLAPTYRDIATDGQVRVKADMLNAIAHLKTKATDPVAKVAADFRAAHPALEVAITGDTAVLSFHSMDPQEQAIVRAIDVFAYDHGMWRGVLSMRSGATRPAPKAS